MTKEQHLLMILSEECAEVAQRVSKALRFGLDEAEPGQLLNNRQRIEQELDDLLAIHGILLAENILTSNPNIHHQMRKVSKVEEYLDYSRRLGTLTLL